jgi:hypothetical protein
MKLPLRREPLSPLGSRVAARRQRGLPWPPAPRVAGWRVGVNHANMERETRAFLCFVSLLFVVSCITLYVVSSKF